MTFEPVYARGSDGIGGYDLKDLGDKAFAFDYNHSGRLDHIALYRPGHGNFFILEHNNNGFSPVFYSGDGIGGYDLKDPGDQAFAFDYNHSGMLDHIALYRPGHGNFFILEHTINGFSPVFHSGGGIGGYDLKDHGDKAFAFDYNHSGKLDHIALYRPGHGAFFILKHKSG
ncbi:hypothetical protein BDV59DRAFT_201011 [Aspergillus ambiguus]|uniref:uncharacterized protein n=1 Tax=Aspergillus ambiguus TaxID=176160 RepID=UPI003CCDEF2B